VAIEIVLPDSGRVESPTRSGARARLNGLGDSVQAQLVWSSLDTTLEVLDSTTGASVAAVMGTPAAGAQRKPVFESADGTGAGTAGFDGAAGSTRDTLDVTRPTAR